MHSKLTNIIVTCTFAVIFVTFFVAFFYSMHVYIKHGNSNRESETYTTECVEGYTTVVGNNGDRHELVDDTGAKIRCETLNAP